MGTIAAAILWTSRHAAIKPSMAQSQDASTHSPNSSSSDIVEVKRGEITKILLLSGELRAVHARSIFAQSPQETKITYLAPEGSVVKPGDRLVELDGGTMLQKIKDLEEKIVAADNEILKTQSGHEAALRDMDVQLSQLWLTLEQAKVKAAPPVELVPRRDYQENQLALAKAAAEHANQVAKIEQTKKQQAAELEAKLIDRRSLDGQLEQARRNLDDMNIKAPSEGMVIYNDHWSERRKIQVGDVVWSGLSVLQLPDLREMEVFAQVNEVDGPKVSPGQKATIRLDSYPDIQISGSVREISQTAIKAGWMAKANVFGVTIGLDSTMTGIMKPGMSAQVAIGIDRSGPQLLVPRSAVRFDKDTVEVVRIESGGVRRPVAVTVLMSNASHSAVAQNGALKEGDRILSGR
jgi:multidrug resistance efflux pump